MTIQERKKQFEEDIKSQKIMIYSPENKHLFSKESQQFFENFAKEPHKYYSSKYWKKQKERVIEDTQKAFNTIPQPTAKQAIINILLELPDFLPLYNIAEVTTYIIEEWERLEKQKVQKPVEILAKEEVA